MSASPSFNSSATGSDSTSSDPLALILGAIGVGLSAIIGSILGIKWIRERNSVIPTNADGTVNTSALAKRVLESAEAKSPAIKEAASFMGAVKNNVSKLQEFVNGLPLPDSVKSVVNDPTKLLSKKTQDKIHAVEAMVGLAPLGDDKKEEVLVATQDKEKEKEIPISIDELKKQMDTLEKYIQAHKNTQ